MKNIFLSLILIPFLTFGQETEYKKYQHPSYSIEYPVDWVIDESGNEGASFVIYPNNNGDKNKVFVENINLVVQNLGDYNLSISQIKTIVENEISSSMSEPKLIISEIKNRKGFDYHELVAEGASSGMNFKSRIYTYLLNNSLYSLTLVSTAEDYDNIEDITKKIMDSFTLK